MEGTNCKSSAIDGRGACSQRRAANAACQAFVCCRLAVVADAKVSAAYDV